jgi:hypothetical protein
MSRLPGMYYATTAQRRQRGLARITSTSFIHTEDWLVLDAPVAQQRLVTALQSLSSSVLVSE